RSTSFCSLRMRRGCTRWEVVAERVSFAADAREGSRMARPTIQVTLVVPGRMRTPFRLGHDRLDRDRSGFDPVGIEPGLAKDEMQSDAPPGEGCQVTRLPHQRVSRRIIAKDSRPRGGPTLRLDFHVEFPTPGVDVDEEPARREREGPGPDPANPLA